MRPSSKFKKQATREERLTKERADREVAKAAAAERRAARTKIEAEWVAPQT